MNRPIGLVCVFMAPALLLSSCKRSANDAPAKPDTGAASKPTHTHPDGSVHEDHGEAGQAHPEGAAHNEVSLGSAKIGDMQVELAQGHGKLEAGKESHLVVKLPYNDKGQTTVRAWIGTEDRLKSMVGKGTYAPSHDDYDIHAVAPSPLPDKAMWWIEIEKPDGTKAVGSAKPLRD